MIVRERYKSLLWASLNRRQLLGLQVFEAWAVEWSCDWKCRQVRLSDQEVRVQSCVFPSQLQYSAFKIADYRLPCRIFFFSHHLDTSNISSCDMYINPFRGRWTICPPWFLLCIFVPRHILLFGRFPLLSRPWCIYFPRTIHHQPESILKDCRYSLRVRNFACEEWIQNWSTTTWLWTRESTILER